MLRRLVATWGNADHGRLGHGALPSQLLPRVVAALEGTDIAAVSAGGAHTAALADDGTLYTFGLNSHGQLGHSQEEHFCDEPREVLIPEPVVHVSCGHYHTLALSDTGRIWAFGKNESGQLGLGKRSDDTALRPSLVKDLDGIDVAEVCAGAEHSLARARDGSVFSWGCPKNGKLGHGKESFFASWQQPHRSPRMIRALRGVQALRIAAGLTASGVVAEDGSVYTMGYGRFWQLGGIDDLDRPFPALVGGLGGVKQLALGGLHSAAVRTGGQVLTWGGNEHGCVGHGRPGLAVRSPTMITKLEATEVSCGWKHAAAVDAERGALYAWGWGGSAGETMAGEEGASGGQLGLGNDFDVWAPRAVESAVLGSHGAATVQFDQHRSARFRFLSVSCGFNHTTAIIETNALKAAAGV